MFYFMISIGLVTAYIAGMHDGGTIMATAVSSRLFFCQEGSSPGGTGKLPRRSAAGHGGGLHHFRRYHRHCCCSFWQQRYVLYLCGSCLCRGNRMESDYLETEAAVQFTLIR